MQENTVFSVLNAVNCNEHVEKKGNLSYLSWAWAWQMVKYHFPDASYTIYESPDGWNYYKGRTENCRRGSKRWTLGGVLGHFCW